MKLRSFRWVAALLASLSVACTGAYLYDNHIQQPLPVDRSVALAGRFCSPGTNTVISPIKIVVALDTSQSMNVNDPDGTRAFATVDLINALPQDPNVYFAVVLFAGSTTAWLTKTQLAQFDPVTSYTDADKLKLEDQILNLTNINTLPNRDSTDFIKPLSDIYALINNDIATSLENPMSASAAARARYSVIFMSDGHPSKPEDDELFPPSGDAISSIRNLKDLCGDVKVNTVHVFEPLNPPSTICDLTGDAGCPMLMISQDTERLQQMASVGGGDFRDFRNNEPINFLNFGYGQLRRAYLLKAMVATNINSPPGSPLDSADSDGDGLSDADELDAGTDPLSVDTDGDGFSDFVEVHFRALGANFHPNQPAFPDGGGLDPGCPPALRGIDAECDGLLDCDEQIIGTNPTLTDSDGDGVPDAFEWQLGTQPSSSDMNADPDNDGVVNMNECRYHMNPNLPDTNELTVAGYRYTLTADGVPDVTGAQCYKFRVDNISLANTLADTRDGGTGRGAGYNSIHMSVAFVPADDPKAPPFVQTFHYDQARYPIGGIKLPVDGVIPVTPQDFVEGCGGPVLGP